MSRPTQALIYTWTNSTPGAAVHARAALRHALSARGLSGEAISDAVLAASELVANASEHAKGPYELWLRSTAAELLCEVHDHDPYLPELPAHPQARPPAPGPQQPDRTPEAVYAPLSERGRGLQIVDHLTSGRWGFRITARGRKKIAWLAAARVEECSLE